MTGDISLEHNDRFTAEAFGTRRRPDLRVQDRAATSERGQPCCDADGSGNTTKARERARKRTESSTKPASNREYGKSYHIYLLRNTNDANVLYKAPNLQRFLLPMFSTIKKMKLQMQIIQFLNTTEL